MVLKAFATENKLMLIGAGVALVALIILVKKKGAAAAAGAAVGNAAVDLVAGTAGGLATGTVNAVSKTIGIPTTDELISDSAQCRAYMDENGQWSGLSHCTASAYWDAVKLNPFS